MDRTELSRRQILAGLAVTGSSGALVGSGTGALFSDTETFTNNAIKASNSVSGSLTMDLEGEISGTSRQGEITQQITLPANSDEETRNNPAYAWVRLNDCPDTIAGKIWVRLYIRCGENEQLELVSGNFLAVADELRDGLPLDPNCESATPGDQGCLDVGSDLEVVFEWYVDDNFSFDSDDSLSLHFNFSARQCRYYDATKNPFEPESTSCESPPETKGISFIAFCSDSDVDPTLDPVFENEDGEPVAVRWQTDRLIDRVVVKSGATNTGSGGGGGGNGLKCKTYSYTNGKTEGVVSTLNWSDEAKDCDPSSPCPGNNLQIKLEYENGKFQEEP